MARLLTLSRSGVVLCVVAGVAFAAQPVVLHLALGDGGGSRFALLGWRYLLAAVALGLLVRRGLGAVGARTAVSAFALGAVVFAADSGLFYTSIERIPVPLASLVHYLHLPIVVGGAMLASRGLIVSRRQIGAVALVLAGVTLVSGGAGAVDPVGVAIALGSALVYGLYMLLSARLLVGAEPLPAAAFMLAGAATSFMTLAAFRGEVLDVGGIAGVGAIVETALVGSVVAVGAFYSGLSRIGSGKASILLAVDVPIGIGLSALVLGQQLGPLQLVGAALVVSALLLLQLPVRRRRPKLRVVVGAGEARTELPAPKPVAQAA